MKRMIYDLFLGCSVLLVALLGLFHNSFLSGGSLLTGPIPSTHPLTTAGFVILAGAIFFRQQWNQSVWLKNLLCLTMILLSAIRIAEALFPENISAISRGPLTDLLESAGLFGRFSVETAIFLGSYFCFELTRERHALIRIVLFSICLGVLSLGFTETMYSIFLWGNELSVITQIAMWLVTIDLLVRMREKQPFRSFFQNSKSSFYLQIAALALYLLPVVVGAIILQILQVSPEERIPFELVFAGASCGMLAVVLALGVYLDGESEKSPPVTTNNQ